VPNQDAVVWYLRVEQEQAGGVVVLAATGRVSSATSRQLEAALETAIGASLRGVVLDLAGVDYISSAGLRAVHAASQRLAGSGRRLVVCRLKAAVGVSFDLAGLATTLVIEPSRERAVERAGA
jgi:anti-anti-sigma factor